MPNSVDETHLAPAGCKVTTNIQNCTRGNQVTTIPRNKCVEQNVVVHYYSTQKQTRMKMVTLFKIRIMYYQETLMNNSRVLQVPKVQ